MSNEQPTPVVSPLLHYAPPKEGPRHSWLACIVGLFAWGTLVLIPVLWIIGVIIYAMVLGDDMPQASDLFWICSIVGVLLLMGLPPVITAQYLMRRELRLVRLTIFVTAIPALIGLILSGFGWFFAVGNIDRAGLFPALLAPVLILIFGGALWLAVELEDHAGFRNSTRYDNLRF